MSEPVAIGDIIKHDLDDIIPAGMRERVEAWAAMTPEERGKILQWERDQEREKAKERAWTEIMPRLREVPLRYREAEPGPAQKWLDEFYAGDPKGLLLTGNVGTGKTHTSWGIYQAALRNEILSTYMLTVPGLLDELRPREDGDHLQTLRRYQTCALLILDDLGAHKHSEWAEEQLFSLIDTRYSWNKALVVASNMPAQRLKDVVGDRIASRLAGMCEVVTLVGKDRRRP